MKSPVLKFDTRLDPFNVFYKLIFMSTLQSTNLYRVALLLTWLFLEALLFPGNNTYSLIFSFPGFYNTRIFSSDYSVMGRGGGGGGGVGGVEKGE